MPKLYKPLIFLLFAGICAFNAARAQTVKAIEYFFDTDPGVGNGTRVNLNAAQIIDTTLVFDMSALSFGLHQLFVRALDSDDEWSLYQVYPVIKGSGGQTAVVQKMEYFFDTDPGTGNGTAIAFTPSGQIDTTVSMDLSSLSPGIHQLFVRSMDNMGRWSLYHSSSVVVGPGTTNPLTVTMLEFFIDNDPGVGNGIHIPLQPGFIVDTTVYVPIPTATNDTVNLYVRGMDNRGLYGLYHDTLIKVDCSLFHFEPDLDFIAGACSNDTVSFTTTTNAGQWKWFFGDGDSSSLQNPKHKYLQPGSYDVSLYVISPSGCISDTAHKTVTIQPGITVNAGPDREIYLGETITLQPTFTGNDSAYQWTPDLYLSNNKLRNPVVTGVDDVTYTITVTGKGGCTASDSVFIKVNKTPREIRIPNVFTPNGDGINDEWTIQFLNTYADCRVIVFNRYGQEVFKSTGYPWAWNGTSKGKVLPAATYYYVIEIPGKEKPLKGFVTIIR